jgi:hypothetical protein
MFNVKKMSWYFKIHIISANVMLAGSPVSLGSLLFVNHLVDIHDHFNKMS